MTASQFKDAVGLMDNSEFSNYFSYLEGSYYSLRLVARSKEYERRIVISYKIIKAEFDSVINKSQNDQEGCTGLILI